MQGDADAVEEVMQGDAGAQVSLERTGSKQVMQGDADMLRR